MFRSTATRAAAAVYRPSSSSFSTTSSARLSRTLLHTPPSTAYNVSQRRTFSEAYARKCPSCGSLLPTPLPACPTCFHIAPLSNSATYYEIFGLPAKANRFEVDPAVLKDQFRQLQRLIHPDKWSNRGADAQNLAATMSSIVNKAYSTLLNPYARAEYILKANGIEIGESDNVDDPELILEIMDAREGLDNAETQEEVEQIREENLEKIREILPRLSESVAAEDWPTVKVDAVKLKYLQGIDAAAEAWPSKVHDH